MTAALFPTRGQIEKIRIDLEEASSFVTSTWASDTETRIQALAMGLEALLSATSEMTLLVERSLEPQPATPEKDGDLELVDVSGGCGNFALLRRERR